jgi:hypothetical protein
MSRSPSNGFRARRAARRLAPIVLLSGLLGACSSQALYGAGQGWQRLACDRLIDRDEWNRCMANAGRPYDEYRRDVAPGRAPS